MIEHQLKRHLQMHASTGVGVNSLVRLTLSARRIMGILMQIASGIIMDKGSNNMSGMGYYKSVFKSTLMIIGMITLSTAFLGMPERVVAQTDFEINAESADLKSEFQKELDKWMLRAYEGDRDAQFKVGVLFANDQFGPPDNEQASYWYTQAARQGHVLAQYNLGHQYLTGTGVKRDENDAMHWWLKAAGQQHPLAQFNVGRAYYLGIGLEKDLQQAKLWFERASQNKEPKSTEILKQLGWWDQESVASVAQPSTSELANNAASSEPQETSDRQTNRAVSKVTPIPTASDEIDANTTVSLVTNSDTAKTTNDGGVTQADNDSLDTNISTGNDLGIEGGKKSAEGALSSNRSIAIFTNPEVRSVLITILDSADSLQIVTEDQPWSVVNSKTGFPVWVSKNFIRKNGGQGVVTGSAVNARSVPLVTTGSVVGRLNKGERIEIVDERGDWYRIMSPARFKGWVKTTDYLAALSQEPEPEEQIRQAQSEPPAPLSENAITALSDKLDDNEWLFGQNKARYALQLASFSNPESTTRFVNALPFKDSADLRLFTSRSNEGVNWTYILYGNYEDDEAAKNARLELKQKRAWVRRFGVLQQNRCIAWKKELPAPKELNEFCI